jgi:hypothetical protein
MSLPRRPAPSLHPLWVMAFAVAMLLAQSVGLLHRTAWPTAQSHSHSDVAHDVARHGGDFLGKLFAGHTSEADCQIFDQLSFSDAASALLAVGLSLVLTSAFFTLLQGLACTRWHAQFQARGPPFPC